MICKSFLEGVMCGDEMHEENDTLLIGSGGAMLVLV